MVFHHYFTENWLQSPLLTPKANPSFLIQVFFIIPPKIAHHSKSRSRNTICNSINNFKGISEFKFYAKNRPSKLSIDLGKFSGNWAQYHNGKFTSNDDRNLIAMKTPDKEKEKPENYLRSLSFFLITEECMFSNLSVFQYVWYRRNTTEDDERRRRHFTTCVFSHTSSNILKHPAYNENIAHKTSSMISKSS